MFLDCNYVSENKHAITFLTVIGAKILKKNLLIKNLCTPANHLVRLSYRLG